MAIRGTEAKAYAIKKIAEAFGDNFVGEIDKKVYINCPENGEMVQIAITMTCPKTTVGTPTRAGGIDFEHMVSQSAETPSFKPAEITQEELDNVANLMKELGL